MADENTTENSDHLRELVAEVAAAYFANSHVNTSDIPNVIGEIAKALSGISTNGAVAGETAEAAPEVVKVTPAAVRKSITPNALISFEDGKGYKTLKRHLSTRGLTPGDYREKYGLPKDYPMVAPSYSEVRSAMAKSLGLGRKAGAAKPAPKRGGRKAAGTSTNG